MKEIYLDNAASMPMSAKVIKAVSDANKKYYANPFSIHSQGRNALKALSEAKKELAAEIGVKAEEIILTSGGTEGNSLAIIGTARVKRIEGKNKILISSVEHSSVYENAKELENEGFLLREIPMSEREGLNFSFLEKEIDSTVALVSVMSVNSDVGIINDIARIAKICKNKGVTLHVDHSQGFGKVALQPKSIGVDMVTADAHKIGGPKGVGLLYVRNGLVIKPLFRGGERDRILRAGTENTSGAIGFVAALREYKKINWKKVAASRDDLAEALEKIGARITAKSLPRVATHLHVCFKGIKGEEIVNYLSAHGIYCSTGSACDSESKEKRILKNLGVGEEYAQGAVRFTLAAPLSRNDIKKISNETNAFLNRFKKTNSS